MTTHAHIIGPGYESGNGGDTPEAYDYEALFIAGAVPAYNPTFAPSYTAGTVLGAHSVAELGELLAAKDYEQNQIEAAFAALDKSKIPADVLADWIRDWTALKARYQAARFLAQSKIAATAGNLILGPSLTDAELEWQGVLHALTLTTGHYVKGDVQDLYIRVRALGAHVDESHVPQPTVSADADAVAFKQLDAIAKVIESTVDKAVESDTAKIVTAAVVVLGLGVLVYAFKK
jgi:hypothetical protein